MKRSTDRILTTHAGRLPSPPEVLETARAIQRGESHDREAFDRRVRATTAEVVRQQGETGVDIVSDGEIGRIGPFWGRLAGYGPRALRPGEDPRQAGTPRGEWQLFPKFYEEYWRAQPLGAANLPLVCTGPISYQGHAAIQADIANFTAALAGASVEEAFMCAVSPGWLVPGFGHRDEDFLPHYPSEEAFFFALAEAMREEYRAIVDAGFILQIDDPRVVSGWDVPDPRTNRHLTLEDYRKAAILRVEALNHALAGIPAERVRHHVCWGSWKGPHTVDIPLKDAIEIILRVKAQAHSIEAANVRHEHEWKVWQDVRLPEGKLLIPGVVAHATNLVEHPELVADRLVRYANLVGRENVIAGTDCGLGGRLHPEIVWAKFQALTEGARLATQRLWGR
jgi:5-methyltetrahydropteroyltriglutamate--homocysteine methyltransferase